jgi:predicted ATP-dependent endonuclease of OLD family
VEDKQISIKNFKTLEDIEIPEFKNFNIFIGRNNSGKSAIIEAIESLKFVFEQDNQDYLKNVITDKNLRKEILVSITLSLSDTESRDIYDYLNNQTGFELNDQLKREFLKEITFELTTNFTRRFVDLPENIFIIRHVFVSLSNRKQDVLLYNEPTNDFRITSAKHVHGGWENPISPFNYWNVINNEKNNIQYFPILIFWEFLKSIKYLNPRRRVEREQRLVGQEKLQSEATNLQAVLNTLHSTNIELFQELISLLTRISPEIEKILIRPIEEKVYVEIKIKGRTNTYKLNYVGSGIAQALMSSYQLVRPENSVVLIEEPEIHLHPSAQRELFNFFKNKSETKQIFISTHSMIFTDVEQNINTFIVNLENGKSTIIPIESKSSLRTIKDFIGAKNRDQYSRDVVILVEGDTEERSIPIIAKSLRYNLDSLGIGLFNFGGKDKNIPLILKLFSQDESTIPFLILDNNAANIKEDLVRAGLIANDRCLVLTKDDFIECFGEERIIKVLKESGVELTTEELQADESQKPLIKKIEDLTKDIIDLKKPDLGEKLALLRKDEIEKGIGNETEIEVILSRIITSLN